MDDHGKKDSRMKWKGYDTVRFKDRIGSLRCPNPNCPFILKLGERNRLKFNSTRISELCSALGEIVVCSARKYAAYISEKKARIFHFWTQTCETCKSWNEVENIANRSPISDEFRMRRLSKDNRHYLMEKVMKLQGNISCIQTKKTLYLSTP